MDFLSLRKLWPWVIVLAVLTGGTWLRVREHQPPPETRPRVAVVVEAAAVQQSRPTSPSIEPNASTGATEQQQETPDTCEPQTETEVATFLTKELQQDLPDLGSLLSADKSTGNFDHQFSTLVQILQSAGTAFVDRKPILLLAANQVASALVFPSTNPPTPEMKQKMDQLNGYGLTFAWAQLGSSYEYQDDLLWILWRDYPDTPSGEDAFVLLLNRGWDTSKVCSKASDRFRDVIREGEAFLKQHPGDAHTPTVDYDVAQAYETWWSLSKAPNNNEEEVDPDRYVDGANAREQALTYYHHLTQTYPQSAESACAKRFVDLLQQAKDTRQRRYFCIYD